jgi:riboflavin synthase
MFTGIIEEQAEVLKTVKVGKAQKLSLKINGFQIGESISVDGVCLTVSFSGNGYTDFDVSSETLASSCLKYVKPRQRLNIERALTLNKFVGGHLVSGHVDGVGIVKRKTRKGDFYQFDIFAPSGVIKYLIKKGSIAVDGISLTVNNVMTSFFSTMVIPETLNKTTLGTKREGDKVNLEIDQIAKYVEKFLNLSFPQKRESIEG